MNFTKKLKQKLFITFTIILCTLLMSLISIGTEIKQLLRFDNSSANPRFGEKYFNIEEDRPSNLTNEMKYSVTEDNITDLFIKDDKDNLYRFVIVPSFCTSKIAHVGEKSYVQILQVIQHFDCPCRPIKKSNYQPSYDYLSIIQRARFMSLFRNMKQKNLFLDIAENTRTQNKKYYKAIAIRSNANINDEQSTISLCPYKIIYIFVEESLPVYAQLTFPDNFI